jgi:serine/threonine protein kinase
MPAVLQRFQREARLAAQLSHPNVAQVLGVGESGGQPYMVMEFVDGENLQQVVQREGPLPLARAWEYMRQTALALREAACHGIVHRDIKPANLMLSGEDQVKVTDFGISVYFASDVSFDSERYLNSNQFSQFPTILLSLMIIAGYVICIGRWGTTPGKWNMGLKVIRSGKQRVGYGRAFIRLLVFNPGLIGGLSWSIRLLVSPTTKRTGVWLWMLTGIDLVAFILLLTSCVLIQFSARRRGLHDFAAGTRVVQLPVRRKPRRWFEKVLSLRR